MTANPTFRKSADWLGRTPKSGDGALLLRCIVVAMAFVMIPASLCCTRVIRDLLFV